MKKCECGNKHPRRFAEISAKHTDHECHASNDDLEFRAEDIGIDDGEYVCFTLCLDCGRIQGKFPFNADTYSETGNKEKSDPDWTEVDEFMEQHWGCCQ